MRRPAMLVAMLSAIAAALAATLVAIAQPLEPSPTQIPTPAPTLAPTAAPPPAATTGPGLEATATPLPATTPGSTSAPTPAQTSPAQPSDEALGSTATPPPTATFVPTPVPTPIPPLVVYAGQGSGSVAEEDFIGDPNHGGNGVRVVQGTTITWSNQSDSLHTVTFPAGNPLPDILIPQPEDPTRSPMLNPQMFFPTLPNGPWDGTTFVNAELSHDRPQVSITFARPGTYSYRCLHHPNMAGSVEVVPPGAPGVTTQAAIDQQAAAVDALRVSQAGEIFATRGDATRVAGGRGTDLWFVRAGTAQRNDNLDIQAFLPDVVNILQGDTVVWYVDNQQAHTVTFRPAPDSTQTAELYVLQNPDGTYIPSPPPGEPLPSNIVDALANPDVGPRLVLGPGAERTSNPIYDGHSLYSSGLIGEHPRIAVAMDKVWALTFNTPGSFDYTCLLHEDLGMTGTVNVQPR